MNINEMARDAFENSVDHGFWKGPEGTSFPVKIALLHSEASEALEEYRKNDDPRHKYYRKDGKPEGVGSELADVAIRLGDLAIGFGIDLEAEIKEKMEFNKGRPHKHGKVI